jgi:spore coat protein B
MNKSTLETLIGKVIKVDRGGPESRVGKLLEVGSDYFVLHTREDGVLYYKGHHVKSITENTKNRLEYESTGHDALKYKSGKDFKDLISHFKEQWVRINRGGPEKIEGILTEVNHDFLTIVLNEEVIRMSMFHVRNLSNTLRSELKRDDKKDDKKDNKKDSDHQKN